MTAESTAPGAVPGTAPISMTGGEAVARTLEGLGVECVFGIPSVHNLPIYDAIRRRGVITPIGVRHEQGAVHAADGYARVTGRLGVAITSTGPGAANAVPGLFEASFASSPVLMVTGQIDTPYYGKGKGFLHEAERQVAMLSAVTRRTDSVRRTTDIPAVLATAAAQARSGRPAPTAVEIPIDLQYAQADVRLDIPAHDHAWPVDAEAIGRAADLLAAAERPLLWAGGGVVSAGAAEALAAVAERLGAPVVTSVNGRGALPEDDPRCLGPFSATPEVEKVISDADVILAVGTRFQSATTRQWNLAVPGRLIHLDADPGVIGRNYPATVSIAADARLGLQALLAALPETSSADPAYLSGAQAASRAARDRLRGEIGPDHTAIMDTIRELLPAESPIVRDATVPAYRWGDRLIPIVRPRTSLRPTSAAIGPGLPLALGAATGSRQPTLLIQGDGGLMLSIGELATAVQYSLPIIACVFNDGGYGVLRGIQNRAFGAQVGVDLATPSFTALAEAMGARGRTVRDVNEFRPALEEALATDGPTMLDIDMRGLAPMS